MICGTLYAMFLGAAIVALGLLALAIGFYRGLFDLKDRDGAAMPAFLLGAAGVVTGSWLLAAC